MNGTFLHPVVVVVFDLSKNIPFGKLNLSNPPPKKLLEIPSFGAEMESCADLILD